MFYIFIALALLAAILLIGVVLIQKSKGGGLSSSFAGSNQIMGVRRTNNFIEKVTWTLAASILVLSFACAYSFPKSNNQEERRTQKESHSIYTGANYDTPVTEAQAETAEVPAETATETPAE